MSNENIFAAILENNLLCVQSILEKWIYLNIKNEDEYTPLMLASQEEYKDIVQLLLDKDVNVLAKNMYGETALMFATRNGHKDIMQLLLDKELNILAKNNYFTTLLMFVAQGGHKDIEQLQGYGDIFVEHEGGITTLQVSVEKRHKDIAQFLLKKGAEVLAESRDGTTAFFAVAQDAHRNIVQTLITDNWIVDTRINRDIVQTLIAKGALAEDGTTILIMTTQYEGTSNIKTLIDKNTNMLAERKDDVSPRMLAAMSRNKDSTQALNNKNMMDVLIKGKQGVTALIYAAWLGEREMLKLLLEHGADVDAKIKTSTPLLCASRNGDINTAKLLLKHGAKINARGTKNRTALLQVSVSERGYLNMVSFLIKHGAKVNAKDRNGDSALSLAVFSHNYKIALLLADAGGKINGIAPEKAMVDMWEDKIAKKIKSHT